MIKSSRDFRFDLNYFDYYFQQNDEQKKKSFSADIYSGWGILKSDYKSAEIFHSRMERLKNYKLNVSESETVAMSILSQVGSDAYKECLRNRKPFSVNVSPEAQTEPSFTITIHPHPRGAVTLKSTFSITAAKNGMIGPIEKGKRERSGSVNVTGSTPAILITREKPYDETTTISIQVGEAPAEMLSFPPLPTTKLVAMTLRSKERLTSLPKMARADSTFWHHVVADGPDLGPYEYCVEIPENAVIIPKSTRVKWVEKREEDGGHVFDCAIDKHPFYCRGALEAKESPTSACTSVALHNSTKKASATGEGYVTAEVVAVVPDPMLAKTAANKRSTRPR